MWRMINQANAIDAMAINIRLSEPLSSMLCKRLIRDLDSTTNAAGLIDRRPLQGFQVNVANPGEVRALPGLAMSYQKTSLEHQENEEKVANVLASQVDFQPDQLTYQTWKYKNWTKESETAVSILKKPLNVACQSVPISSIRLEYLDRFYFDGDQSSADMRMLLDENSGWISKNIFQTDQLCHCHSGEFAEVTESDRILKHVNADVQDLAPSGFSYAGKRSLQLMTGVEHQFLNGGREFSGESDAEYLSSLLEDLHDRSLTLFKQVLDSDFRKQNGLPQ